MSEIKVDLKSQKFSRINNMKKIIAAANQKGKVGRSIEPAEGE